VVTESRFDQERRWLAEMEQLGPEAVRMLHRQGKPVTSQPPRPETEFVEAWLGRDDRRRVRLRLGLFLLIVAVVLIAVWLMTL
jgi:hypothetical protein